MSPDGGEPRLAIMVLGDADGAENVEAVVDTGFDGELSLSSRMVRRLGLPYAGSARATLADGSRTWFDYHEGRVLWHGEERAVAVLASDGDALIGMALLDGGRLTVDAVPGGDVRIEKLRG
ncbi:MAG: clan AA aspartic protease [Rubrobacteraceae bacterium]